MKTKAFRQALFILPILLLGVLLNACQAEKQKLPIQKKINADWTFNYFPSPDLDEKAIASDFDDRKWPAIALPHTWSTYETTGDVHPFIKYPSEKDDTYWWYGWGIYRKKFTLDKSLKNNLVTVELDGVQKYSKVYLNGHYLGDHKGGFTSFYFDLTPHINWEGENILAVAVNGRRDDKHRIPPMTAGNWDVYSGIYRDVRLVIKNKLHFPFQGSYKHDGGVFITTPEVSNAEAKLSVLSYVKNDNPESVSFTLHHEIFSPSGDLLREIKSEHKLSPGEITSFKTINETINSPELWSPETPVLYKVVSSVYRGNELCDRVINPLGFRYYHWDYTKNSLYVNGEKLNIKGTNRHQEYPWLGDAHPKWIAKMDLEDIKYNLGHNFMRLTHYPNDKYLYQLADSLGIIMVEEVPNIKSIDFDEIVQEQNVREMIRRDRNHPSIFFWSMGNETKDAADSKWAREEDTTRIIHLRKGDHGGGDFVQHDHTNLDMEQLLRVTVRGWFDTDDAPPGFSSTPENGQHSSNETWQHNMAITRGGSVRGILGENCSTWLYEDHGADREYKNCILKHINPKGWVDMYRQPKYVYWLTKANYTEIPVVFIHPHFWRKKYLGQKKTITIDSNCEEVELFVNGKSMGKKYPSKANFYTLDYANIKIEEGSLKLVGTKNGKTHETSVHMPGTPAKIVLSTEQKEIVANRSGIALIKADILDEKGNPVFDATNTLKWELSGPASLVGAPVYESDIMKFEEWEGTGYTVVPVCNVVRSTNQSGTISVHVSSPGLEPATLEISSILPENEASLIYEEKLKDAGREEIQKDPAFSKTIQSVNAIFAIRENHKIEGQTKVQMSQNLKGFIGERNHGLETNTVGYQTFIDLLTDKLWKLNGELIADDYNFAAEQFNTWFLVQQIILKSPLSDNQKQVALQKYANDIILNAKPVDLEEIQKEYQ